MRSKQLKLLPPHANVEVKKSKSKGNGNRKRAAIPTKNLKSASTKSAAASVASAIKSQVSTNADSSDLKLYIPTSVVAEYAAMQLEAGKKEIGGIGIVEAISEKEFNLKKLFVATSSHSGTLNVMDAAEVGSALFRASKMGMFNTDHVVFWHTHPGFGCFWSATDVNAVEEEIMEGGKVINLLFSDPGTSIARFDYIKNFEEFKVAHLAEEKELIKQHQEEAKEEAQQDHDREVGLGMGLRKLMKISDVPSYLEIVKTIAESRNIPENTYFVRERAL